MQTPRPDHFTYPQGIPADSKEGETALKHSWIRGVFIAGLIGAFTLGLALSLAG